MNEQFSLTQIASPLSPIGSTVVLGTSLSSVQVKTFSMPSFLYYALKAKALSARGFDSETNELAPDHIDIRGATLKLIRTTAKDLYHEITMDNLDLKNYVSAELQNRLLHKLLGERESREDRQLKFGSHSINAIRAGKNITIPNYLLNKLIEHMGSKKTARDFIHEITFQIKQELVNAKSIDSQGRLVGHAANSSWSRKVHNRIFIELIKLSGIKELSQPCSILQVRMFRDRQLETLKENK